MVVKDATSPTALEGVVTYSLTVTNRGPRTATNVQLADPAPSGISYLTASPSQGTCTVEPALVMCNLGTLASGATATVTVTGRATAVGTHVNVATVTGSGGTEANPADNVDDASTVVPAPLTPPTPKPAPKPKPKPAVCLNLTVSPRMIRADGDPDRIVVRVTAANKRVSGVRVLIRGNGVRASVTSGSRGIAVVSVNPRRAGIIRITATSKQQRVCGGARRIGVVGVFLPPLTG